MPKRIGIGKSQRFRIFARDGFTCRYCGRQSDVVPLAVDHVIPVCKGGTNDDENLITSCEPCNAGKGSKLIEQTVPSETDRLRLSQERNEQLRAARAAKTAAKARSDLRQTVLEFWCSMTGRDCIDRDTLSVMVSYVSEHGPEVVFRWIEKAVIVRGDSDREMGRYVSGIRRKVKEEQK